MLQGNCLLALEDWMRSCSRRWHHELTSVRPIAFLWLRKESRRINDAFSKTAAANYRNLCHGHKPQQSYHQAISIENNQWWFLMYCLDHQLNRICRELVHFLCKELLQRYSLHLDFGRKRWTYCHQEKNTGNNIHKKFLQKERLIRRCDHRKTWWFFATWESEILKKKIFCGLGDQQGLCGKTTKIFSSTQCFLEMVESVKVPWNGGPVILFWSGSSISTICSF